MEQATSAVDLQGILTALRRRRWIIIATAALAVAIGLAIVLVSEPVYEARVEVLIEPDVPFADPEFLGRAVFFEQELQTQLRFMTSDVVLRRATDALGLPRDAARGVTATLQPDTRVINVAARDPDPQRAADLVEAVASQYLALRLERATELLLANRDGVASQVEDMEANIARLDEALAEADQSNIGLVSERWETIRRLSEASARLAELNAGIAAQTGGGQIIEPAVVPRQPVAPAPARTGVVALILGLGLGVVLALARDTLDEAVRGDDDVTTATGRPILGRVPTYSEDVPEGVVLLTSPEAPEAEAYRDLRTNLRFAAADVRSVAVTSSVDAEGKSSIAANLAVAASLAGFDVVLVDADLRRPALHTAFGVPNGIGLSDALAGEQRLYDGILAFDDPPLHLLTAGRLPPNPSELLGSQALADILKELADRFELVVVDTPPTLAASDAQEVASLVDATIVVVENERAGRRALRETVERLERAGGRVVGAVSNRVDPQVVDYYYYRQA